MSYEVEIKRDGRGGWVYYREGKAVLPFDWDITSVGFEVYLPPSVEWDDFCRRNNATRCNDRRAQIVERVAEEVRRKRARKAKVTIDDLGISFSFEGDWLYGLISRILGV